MTKIKRRILSILLVLTLISGNELIVLAETSGDIFSTTEPVSEATIIDSGMSGVNSTWELTEEEVLLLKEKVTRVYGANRYATSFAIADAYKTELGVNMFDSIIVANGTDFPDALAGSYFAAVKNAPILMSSEKNAADIYDYVSKNMFPNGTVYILGGEVAVPKQIEDALKEFNVVRLYGNSRYETNIEILKEAGISNQPILISTGTDFADSLSASATGLPILLVGESLTPAQREIFETYGDNGFYILGGKEAVCEDIENEIKKYGAVKRVSGENRYETSIAVANEFFNNPTHVVLTCGKNYPDGLCGGVLAESKNTPLVLVANDSYSASKDYVDKNQIKSGTVLGGNAVISDIVIYEIYRNSITTETSGKKVTITTQPRSVVVAEGEKARVTFEAVGDGLTYEWYIKNVGETSFKKSSSFSGNTYTTVMNEVRAGRQLYCKVTDKYGNSVTTETVTIDMEVAGITPPADNEYPYVCDKLSWEEIQSFPIASESMSIEELRTLCVDFFRYTKSFAWTPSEDFCFIKNTKGKEDSVLKGTVYGGLPYIHKGSGNIYRVMDFYDTETGVLDVSMAEENPRLFGSQCSLGSYWGWGRVINSAQFGSTYNMVPSRGFLPLGEYIYDESVVDYREGPNTIKICNANEDQVMYESYALLQPADGLVYYRGEGHVIMCSEAPVVVRNEDGTINPDESYIKFIDQAQSWKNLKQSNGDTYSVKKNIDSKYTFSKLLKEYYIPFTFAEFLGTDPVEDLECLFDYTGTKISVLQLQQVIITSNYGISDLYAHVTDQNGNVVYTAAKRIETASVTETMFSDAIDETCFQQYSNRDYSVEVIAQFVNGERRTLYTGQLKESR